MALFGDDDKTEQPTGRRLKDAREKGQIARSKRSAPTASLVAGLVVLVMAGEWMLGGLLHQLRVVLGALGDDPRRVLVAGDMVSLIVVNLRLFALIAGPVALAVLVTVIVVQGGARGLQPHAAAVPAGPDASQSAQRDQAAARPGPH